MNESTESGPNGRRRIWPIFAILLAVILIVMLGPILSTFIAASIANWNGCQFGEGSVYPCLIGGADWGGTLYLFGMMAWFGLITLPLGGLALLVWLLALIVTLFARRRKSARGPR